jgi:3-hydroxybutyryl-CoA dehydrogenase
MTLVAAFSLTAWMPWRVDYRREAVNGATQDAITTRLGPPQAERTLTMRETVWRYQSYQGDLLCLEYIAPERRTGMRFEEIRTIGVIGAGVMGAGIAQVFAQAGYQVRLHARHQATLDRALARIRANQTQQITGGLLTAEQAQASLDHLFPTTRFEEAVQGVELINENVPEHLELKRHLFRRIEALVPLDTILTSDTSSLPLTKLAEGMQVPERMLVWHWINPPQLIPVVEVVLGPRTDAAIAETVVQMAKRIGKMPIVVRRDVPGFVLARLQVALLREACHLVQEGIATERDIDQALTAGLGLRWAVLGPLRVMDLGGLQTLLAVSQNLYPELSRAQEPPSLVQELVTHGHLGVSTGRGFYTYQEGEAEQMMAERDDKLMRLLRTLGWDGST